MALLNLARMTTPTTGQGTITLGSAVPGFLSFADAGAVDGQTYSYAIEDGNNREVGRGVYTAAGTTLTRSVLYSTNAGAAIALSGSAEVFIHALAEDIPSGPLSGFRNKIINGDFDIWQRGTFFSGSSPYYGPDRWRVAPGAGSAVIETSRDVLGPGTTAVPGNAAWGVVFDRTASGTGSSNIQQRIESVRTLAGKRVTLTLYSYSGVAATLPFSVVQSFGSGGTPSAAVETSVSDIVLAGAAFEKQQFVFTLPSISGKTLGTNGDDYLAIKIDWPIDQIATGSFRIYHVSLVEGDATGEADPFAPRHVQQELALCKRYYEQISVAYRLDITTGEVYGVSGSFQVEKRIVPTCTVVNNGSVGFGSGFLAETVTKVGAVGRAQSNITAAARYLGILINADAEL